MSDLVLVVNAGSSSLKYSLVDASSGATPASGLVERIGEPSGVLTHRSSGGSHRSERPIPDHEAALKGALDAFEEHGPSLSSVRLGAVGHRVVHGGSTFSAPALVDDDLVSAVSSLVPLAPLHNPANLEGIATARRLFPTVPQVAIFDTAFHQTLPPHAYTYALPHDWVEEHQIRRYGFHGTSHSFVASAAARFLGRPLSDLNLIVLHLGNGASATAIRGGESDVDPALHVHLHRQLGWSLETVDEILNRSSGLKGLAGFNDFRELDRQRASGSTRAQLAFDVYCYRIRKYVGAYYAVLGTVDAIVFTAGVGQNASSVRSASLSGLQRLGIQVDPELNLQRSDTAFAISADGGDVTVLVVPTDEEWEIAREAMAVVRG
jgi:acetate kinase